MTNVSSGSKRPWDGSNEKEVHKRPREDWREVHLRSPRSPRGSPHGDRRMSGDRRRGEYRPRSRDHDRRRSNDYGRDRDRRDDRNRDRDRRDPHLRREDSRTRQGGTSSPHTPLRYGSAQPNGHTGPPKSPHIDSEKEEGEISPRHSPQPGSAYDDTRALQPTPSIQPPPQPESQLELELTLSPPPQETLEARRARRKAIEAKYAAQAKLDVANLDTSSTEPVSAADTPPISSIAQSSRASLTASPEPEAELGLFELEKGQNEEEVQLEAQAHHVNAGQLNAADYDPELDRRTSEKTLLNGGAKIGEEDEIELIEEEEEEEEEEEDVDDMFAIATTEKKTKKVKKVKKVAKPAAPALVSTALDNTVDKDGYYNIILGEQIDEGRYQVFSLVGGGTYARVVKARVLQGDAADIGKEVAIKIIRIQELMYRSGLKEVQTLNRLRETDPENRKHIIRLERTFEHRGHLCLVFESMSMNLRDVIKRYGKDVGLNIRAVRAYAQQLFTALNHLKKCNIIHADIKPDNIVVNEAKSILKICDLGSAKEAPIPATEIAPSLVSRYYRAPEIMLGVPFDGAIDMWAAGCTLYELYTGKILFNGRNNNDMLRLIMLLKGRFNAKIRSKARFWDTYFNEAGFLKVVDSAGAEKAVHIDADTKNDVRSRIMPPASERLKSEELRLLTSFVDLLDKCFTLDPARRLTPHQALSHPFIRP